MRAMRGVPRLGWGVFCSSGAHFLNGRLLNATVHRKATCLPPPTTANSSQHVVYLGDNRARFMRQAPAVADAPVASGLTSGTNPV